MARTLRVFPIPTASTITIDVMLSNALVETIVMVEESTAKLSYTGTIVTASGAEYQLNIKSSGTLIGGAEVFIGATDGVTYEPFDKVNIKQINDSEIAAQVVAAMNTAFKSGTVDDATFSPTSTTFETSRTDNSDEYVDQALFWTSGANTGLTSRIAAYAFANSKDKLTVSPALPNTPADGDTFYVLGRVTG